MPATRACAQAHCIRTLQYCKTYQYFLKEDCAWAHPADRDALAPSPRKASVILQRERAAPDEVMFPPQTLEAVPLNCRQLGEAPSKLFRLLLKLRGLQSMGRPRDHPCLTVRGEKRHLLPLGGGTAVRDRHLPGSAGRCKRRGLRGARSLQSQFTGNRPPRSGANHRSPGRGLTPRRSNGGRDPCGPGGRVRAARCSAWRLILSRTHRRPASGACHWCPDGRLLGDRRCDRNDASGSDGVARGSTLELNVLGLGSVRGRVRKLLDRRV